MMLTLNRAKIRICDAERTGRGVWDVVGGDRGASLR